MRKIERKKISLILWEKDAKFVIWNEFERERDENNTDFFVFSNKDRKFYFSLDDFKNSHIEDDLSLYKNKKKIKYTDLARYRQLEINQKFDKLGDELNLFQKTLFLKLKIQYLLLSSRTEERIIKEWILKINNMKKNENKFIKKRFS